MYLFVSISEYLLIVDAEDLVPHLQPPVDSCGAPLGDGGHQHGRAATHLLPTLDVEAEALLAVLAQGDREDGGETVHQVTAGAV